MSCHFTPKKVLSPIHLEFITKKCSLPIFWLLHPSTSTSLVKSFVHTFFFTLLLLHGWKCCFNIFLVFTSRAVTSSHPTPQSGRDAIIWADELLIWAWVVGYDTSAGSHKILENVLRKPLEFWNIGHFVTKFSFWVGAGGGSRHPKNAIFSKRNVLTSLHWLQTA